MLGATAKFQKIIPWKNLLDCSNLFFFTFLQKKHVPTCGYIIKSSDYFLKIVNLSVIHNLKWNRCLFTFACNNKGFTKFLYLT